MESILAMLDAIEVELIPSRDGGEYRAWNVAFAKRVERQPENSKADGVSGYREEDDDDDEEESRKCHHWKVKRRSSCIETSIPFSPLCPELDGQRR